MKSVKLSNYFNIVKPEYEYIKLTPSNSIKNTDTHKIAKAINSIYRSLVRNIEIEEHKLIKILGKEMVWGTKYSYKVPSKVSYYVYIEKKRIEFYFIIPKHYRNIIKEKLSNVWGNITMDTVEEIPMLSEKATKYYLVYEKEDGLSLKADRRDNSLLKSNLNVIDILEEGDKIAIFYNFIPTNQFGWSSTYKNTISKIKKNQVVLRNKTGIHYLFKLALSLIAEISNLFGSVLQDMSDSNSNKTEGLLEAALSRMNNDKKISDFTYKKGEDIILNTQIVLLSESDSKLREINNARALVNSYDVVTDDNRLVGKKFKSKNFKLTSYSVSKAPTNKVSANECQNFISLAGREILEQYNFIDKINTTETQVPEELRSGIMCIGENTFRGNTQKAYLSNDKEYKYLTLVLIAPTRAGKTTLISNLARDALNNNEVAIFFDFVGNCELSEEVASLFPQNKVLNIECKDSKNLQGLGYNEVPLSTDTFVNYANAKKQSTQLKTLIDSINSDDKQLAPKMERYLTSASLVVFISGGSINDVFRVLQSHKERRKYINMLPTEQYSNFEEYLDYLSELDDYDKQGQVNGTKLHLITGIIDRLNKLKDNPYMEMMLKKGCDDNVNLVDQMQKNQLICIKMPEEMFSTDSERDVYCTYWITKLWMALQIRKSKFKGNRDKMKKVNLVIDELYQVKHTEEFLTSKLSRLAKFNLKPIISCHYLNQIKIIRDELRSANASYMLISGCDKKNFDEFKDELYPFTVEDLLNLERHTSLNYIKCKSGYSKFITRLPPPLSEHK